MSNVSNTILKSWKEQDALIDQHLTSVESARDAKIDTLANVSVGENWSVEALADKGVARSAIKSTLAQYHGVAESDLNASEVAKYCTYAHPKVRDRLPTIRTSAAKVTKANRAWDKNAKVENTVYKICKHLKSDDVTSVKAATEAAEAEYADSKKEKENAPKAGTVEAFNKRMASLLKGAEKFYTKDSVEALKAAAGGLELKPVETPEESAPAELSDMLASLAGGDDTKTQAIAALMELITK